MGEHAYSMWIDGPPITGSQTRLCARIDAINQSAAA
jgi:hypothetical protein